MGLMDATSGRSLESPHRSLRRRVRVRVEPEFEAEIRQLYSQIMDNPVPPHLLQIVRAAIGAKP